MTFDLPSQASRHAIAAGVLIVYLAGSAWLVHTLGHAHRARLIAAIPTPVAPEPSRSDPSPVPDVAPSPVEPIIVDSKPPEPEPPTPEPARPPESPVVTAEPPPVAPEVGLDPFWDRPEQRKVWDLTHLTPADERQLGAALHQAIGQMHSAILTGDEADRLQAAAEPFLKARGRQDVEYTFTVLDCPEVNAFSHPGGYIYVCRGLFDQIPAEDNQALEFLVGHEIAHVDQGHAVICLRDPALPKEMGTSLLYASFILPLAYTKEQELAADRWACQTMARQERSKHETLTFLRMLTNHNRTARYANRRLRPGDSPTVAPIDNHLRAHVPPRDRVTALVEKFWLAVPPSR